MSNVFAQLNNTKGRITINGLDVAIENPAYTYRKSTDKTGQQWSCLMQAHYGYINGYKGNDGDNVDVFVGNVPENDTAYIINQKTQGGFFDEHKVMLGFLSQQQAVDTYQHCFERGWTGLMSVVPCTMSQLKWWLANGDKARPVTKERLPYAGLERLDSVVWGGTDDANLYSHGGQLSKLLYQIRMDDVNNQALEPLAYHDMIAELGNQGFMYENYDALIVEYNKLERKAKQLLMVMQGAASTVKPVGVTVSKPLTKNGVSNVIAWFEMDDGQAVGVFFHNPDKNPKKLDPTDEMISYKWVLNKKDITIAVAPENGKDVIIRTVAKRIMLLVEKNHDRFMKANSDKAELNQKEQSLGQLAIEKQSQLDALHDDIKVLEAQKAEKEVLATPAQAEAERLAQEQAAIQTPPLGFVGVWDSKSGQYPFQSITGSKIASFATREEAEADFKASAIQQPSSIDYSKYPVITTDDRYGEIIEVPTIWGDKVRVAKRQLENVNRTLLKRFTKAGKEVDGDSIHRENLLVGDAKLTKIAQIEKELKEKGYKVAPFPKSKQQEKKLIDEGYVGYLLDGNGWIKPSFALAVIYAIPPISQPEPVTLTGKELENPTPPQDRPSNWRTNLANARAVAKSLGLETKGKKLDRLVKDIDKAEALPNRDELDPTKLAELGVATITSIGHAENIYIEKDGKQYYSKVGNPQLYALGEWDFAKYPEGKQVAPVTQPVIEPPTVANGKIYDYLKEMGKPDSKVEFDDDYMVLVAIATRDINNPMEDLIDDEYDLEKISKRLTPHKEPLFKEAMTNFNKRVIAGKVAAENPDRDYLQSIIDGKLAVPVTQPVQTPVVPEPTPASNKKMYTPKDILDSDLSIDEKISEAEKLLESSKLNAAKQKIKIDESNKIYWTHARNAEVGYLFTDLPKNASLASVVHAGIGLNVGFIEYLKNLKESPPKIADTQAQTTPDIGDTVIGDTTLSDLFKSDMDKKHSHSVELRVARQSILDAEDAAANAIQSNSIDAFSKYADMFPKTYNALLNWIKSSMTNPDRDYLQSIIDGEVDPLTVDMDAVIALAEKYDGDTEITPLLDQALEVINQAEQEAAKGI